MKHLTDIISRFAITGHLETRHRPLSSMRNQPFTLLLHIALAVILAGAIVTHFYGIQGYLTLYSGDSPVCRFMKESGPGDGHLPFSVRLLKAETVCLPGSDEPKDFRSMLSIDGNEVDVAMNHPGSFDGWRFYQADIGYGYSTLLISHDPWGVGITYAGYILLGIGMIGFFFQRHTRWKVSIKKFRHRRDLLAIAVIAVSLALAYLLWYTSRPMAPVLSSPLLPVHVMVVIVAYTMFLMMAIMAAIALASKSERFSSLNRILLAPAVCLLGAGIFIGAVWANQTWGRYWGWDPKETSALVMWLVYALPLHWGCRPFRFLRSDKAYNIYILLAVLTVAFTYFGANYFIPGLHSYA